MTHTASRRRKPPAPAPMTVCQIPTYEGSGQTIHPSVVDMGPAGWGGGYRWWMVDTPLPGHSDDYENPSIFCSRDRVNWEVPAGVTNPIVPAPSNLTFFNFDPELMWDARSRTMHFYWGYSGGYMGHAMSSDGHQWTILDPIMPSFPAVVGIMSPGVAQADDGSWRMMTYTIVADNAQGNQFMWRADDLHGPWTLQGQITITSSNWATSVKRHGDMIRYKGRWLSIHSDTSPAPSPAITRLMISDDHDDAMVWRMRDGDMLPTVPSSYRPTIAPSTEEGYLDVWCSNQIRVVYYTRLHESFWFDIP